MAPLSKIFMFTALAAADVLASSAGVNLTHYNTFQKRYPILYRPEIKKPYTSKPKGYPPRRVDAFTSEQRAQIRVAIDDAMVLAAHALEYIKMNDDGTHRDSQDRLSDLPIFRKYFTDADFHVVTLGIWELLGKPRSHDLLSNIPSLSGSANLEEFTIYADENQPPQRPSHCGPLPGTNGRPAAVTQQAAGICSRIILCPPAYRYPSLHEGSPTGRGAPTCRGLGKNVNFRMATLGHVLLREYFLKPSFTRRQHWQDGVREFAYHPWGCMDLRNRFPQYAEYNADSYAWFATETYWTKRCGRTFGDPPELGQDPATGEPQPPTPSHVPSPGKNPLYSPWNAVGGWWRDWRQAWKWANPSRPPPARPPLPPRPSPARKSPDVPSPDVPSPAGPSPAEPSPAAPSPDAPSGG